MTAPRPSRTLYIVLATLLILLPLLAVLQYRWIGEVSQSDRRRLEEHLTQSGARFVGDFNRELARILLTFQVHSSLSSPDLAQWFLQQYEESTTTYPALVKRVFLANWTVDGLTLQQFSSKTGALDKIEWPAELKNLREGLEARSDSSGRPTPPPPMEPLNGGSPIFPVPIRVAMSTPAWVLVEFNEQTLFQEFLPAMIARHFSATDVADYRIAIVTRGPNPELIYKSDTTLTEAELTTPDLRLRLFSPEAGRGRPPGGLPGDAGPRGDERFRLRRGELSDEPFRGGARPQFGGMRGGGPVLAGSWELVVEHRSGSLDAAIESLRRRNLGISFGILLLLASSVVMVVISSHRARSLAHLQMEFVARVSHELRTPLAIIRSAAYNVANGVVSDEKDVREYASMVQAEGQRLSTMVDQILTFSQTEAGRDTYELRPVQVSLIISRVVGLHQAGNEIDQDVAGNLPKVNADERALTDCLQNLLSNAVKYGRIGAAAHVKVEARRADVHTVIVTVADFGPGIDSADLPHIFEPFYRGKNVRSDTPGSGLGLNLVRRLMSAQGGKVTVESEPGQGARFTLHLTAIQESPS